MGKPIDSLERLGVLLDTFAARGLDARSVGEFRHVSTRAIRVEIPDGYGNSTPLFYRGPSETIDIVRETIEALPRRAWLLVESAMRDGFTGHHWRRCDAAQVELDEDAWAAIVSGG